MFLWRACTSSFSRRASPVQSVRRRIKVMWKNQSGTSPILMSVTSSYISLAACISSKKALRTVLDYNSTLFLMASCNFCLHGSLMWRRKQAFIILSSYWCLTSSSFSPCHAVLVHGTRPPAIVDAPKAASRVSKHVKLWHGSRFPATARCAFCPVVARSPGAKNKTLRRTAHRNDDSALDASTATRTAAAAAAEAARRRHSAIGSDG
jgi:hypothetical protein